MCSRLRSGRCFRAVALHTAGIAEIPLPDSSLGPQVRVKPLGRNLGKHALKRRRLRIDNSLQMGMEQSFPKATGGWR